MTLIDLRQRWHRTLSAAFLALILFLPAQVRAGIPDPSFGINGIAEHPTAYALLPEYINYPSYLCCRIQQQADGKILVAGATDAPSPRLVLRRFLSNGNVDLSFGLGGEAVVDAPPAPTTFVYGVPYDIKVQNDGKIIVTGYIGSTHTYYRFAVWRFMPGGYLDQSFGGDGLVTRFTTEEVYGRSIALRSNGFLSVLTSNNRIACITPTGGVCPGRTSTITLPGQFRHLALQPGDKLLVVGGSTVRRYSLTGVLDTTFGNQGVASFSWCAAVGGAAGLELLPNGDFYVGTSGCLQQEYMCWYKVVRFTSKGAAGNSFAGNGCLGDGTPLDRGIPGYLDRMRTQADAKLTLQIGRGHLPFPTCPPGGPCGSHWRYNADGTQDLTFDVETPFQMDVDFVIQPDGKIVTLGTNYTGSQDPLQDFYLGRYIP